MLLVNFIIPTLNLLKITWGKTLEFPSISAVVATTNITYM